MFILALWGVISFNHHQKTWDTLNRQKPVGGFNPSEKYARQIGSFPQVGMKIKNIWNHHPISREIDHP